MRASKSRYLLATAMIAMSLAPAAVPALGQEPMLQVYDLPRQPLDQSLKDIARRSGLDLLATGETLAERDAPPLRGSYSIDAALAKLLTGTDLVGEVRGGAIYVRGRAEAPAALNEILVTGTRIRGTGPVGSKVMVVDRAEIERTGLATTQQLAQTLPQNYGGGANESTFGVSRFNNSAGGGWGGSSINLRGIGGNSTLVLVNGHRLPAGGYGSFTDISLIPSTAVERIEVLADGASAIYGSDAVAGVVNLSLRKIEGAETRLRYGSADGDFSEIQAGHIMGRKWANGSITAAYEYYRRGRLANADRAFATEDLTRFGGPNYSSGYSNPGTIVAGGQTFAIPAGQDGTDLTADMLRPGQNLSDLRAGADLLPRQTTHSAYLAAEQELTSNLTLYGETLFARRSFHQRETEAGTQVAITVPVTNPFYVDPIGTGQPVSLRYSFAKDLGQPVRQGYARSWTSTAGARLAVGDWRVEAFGLYAVQKESADTLNVRNRARLAVALANSDPASSFNMFGDGYTNAPAVIDAIRGSINYSTRYRYWSGVAKADGPLVDLPAGQVKLAIGTEYREELMTSTEMLDTTTLTPDASVRSDFPPNRTVLAGYAELFIPLFSEVNAIPGVRELSLSLAGRIERYNDFGTTRNPRIGLSWKPIDGVRLRGTYGRSFRAPSPNEVASGPIINGATAFRLPDASSPTGTTASLVVVGNDPDMKPERATTWSVGLDLEPAFLPGATASISYYNVDYRGRIEQPITNPLVALNQRATYAPIIDTSPSAAEVAEYFALPTLVNPFGLSASDIQVIVDARRQNIATLRQSGIDFDLGYRFAAAGGDAAIGLNGNYIFELKQAINPVSPSLEMVNTIGRPMDLRLRGSASWSKGPLSISAYLNYRDGYRNTLLPSRPAISSWTTADLQISYALPASDGPLAGLRFSLSATNLFDRDPPYVEYYSGASAIGYDPENASAIGRMISLQVVKSW